MLSTLLIVLFQLLVAAQPAQTAREIQVATWTDSPLEITEVKFRDEKLVFVDDLLPTTTVMADDDWVSQISVVVKNVSPKSITHFAIEQRNTSEKFASAAIWGARPGALGATGKSLAPNQSAIIKFDRAASRWIGAKRIQIFADKVFFDNDATYMWSYGQMLKQNPADPTRYEVVRP